MLTAFQSIVTFLKINSIDFIFFFVFIYRASRICRMMAYEGSENAWDNFGKFINQLHPETKTLIRKLERILNKLYR